MTISPNMVEQGESPCLPPARLEELGYKILAYPLTLLSSAARAMRDAPTALRVGAPPADAPLDFSELQEVVGFDHYHAERTRYE
ncbi:MAG: hypothetical protein V3U03_09605 [Myxococcota bacterium]